MLFKEIETTMQAELIDHLKNSTVNSIRSSEKTIVDLVLQSNNVQFYWVILHDIQNDKWSKELLTHIITLWLTFQGFNISMEWMQEYNHAIGIDSKKKKGLRKELKNR